MPSGEITTFQQLIFSLQHYWAAQGCAIIQPLDLPVGAGTSHPITFLQALGPEPIAAAYVQPSRRPTDGRYGANPNRLQHYYQFQVVIKPAPLELQTHYLNSLRALGINPQLHDIRFVEDNWENPTLGAWGLGWEVWLNGMEITQFTYFQQVGGLTCQPVTGEITYGLERLAMVLQSVDNVYDLVWSQASLGQISYGDLWKHNEVEHSTYNFEKADVQRTTTRFETYLLEAETLLQTSPPLPRPAYEAVLQATHQFNLLDARKALSVTERQRAILRIRTLTKSVAQSYLASRELLRFPRLLTTTA